MSGKGNVQTKGLKGSNGAGPPAHISRDPACKPTARQYEKTGLTFSEPTRSEMRPLDVRNAYASTVGDLFEYAAKKCRQRVETIIQECEAKHKKFFDQKFYYASRKVMYPEGTPDDCTVTEPTETARLSELFAGYPLINDDTGSNDITQGAIGDCFFIGAVSALASCTAKHLNPLARLFACYSQESAVYGVMFFKNGGWEWVIVDDIIAMTPDKTPLYANASQGELWPYIIEKAYAKIHFCWDAIDCGWGREALADMTGGCEHTINMATDQKLTVKEFQAIVDDPLTILGCALGAQVEEAGGVGRAGESGAVFGLFKGHAYSVIRFAVTSDGKAFVRVRNPWGNDAEWKGPYSDNAPEWKTNAVAMKELAPEFKADGAFWMIWDDFKKYFTDIDVCKFFENNWVTATQFGTSKGKDFLVPNNMFVLEIKGNDDQKLPIVLILGQDDPKAQSNHTKQKTSAYGVLRMSIYRLKNVPADYKDLKQSLDWKVETKRLYNRQVDETLQLPPGLYSIVPQVLECPDNLGYYIRAFGPPNVQLKLWRFDNKDATLVVTDELGAVEPPPTLVPPGVGKGSQIIAAKPTTTLKATRQKYGGGGGGGGPEHIYRDPKCKPTARQYEKTGMCVPEPTRSACRPVQDHKAFASSVGGLFEYAATQCRQRVQDIIALCEGKNKKFFDKSFYFASRKVMYPDGSPDDCTVTEPTDTARLSELYPGRPLLDADGACSNDITQGAIGDCFFIGAVSALASCTAKHLNPLQRLFACYSQDMGVYGVMLFKNGGWEWVIVDDVIAVNPDKTPMYANASQSELWPMLIEKAYAKMHYYWDSIDGGWGREALADMTGGYEHSVDIKSKVTRADFQAIVDDPLTILGCAVGQHVEESGGVGHAGESGAVFGLFKGHAYSVIRFAVTSDGKAFVRVRNPWGNDAEWKGPYADNGPEWKKNPVAMKELAPEFKADGAFWMIWEDFQKYFTDIDVCHFFENNWVTATQFGTSKGVSFLCADNTFILEIIDTDDKKQPIILTLGQDDPKAQSDHAKQKQGSYAALRMSVYRLKSLPESYKGMREVLDWKVETKRLVNRQVHDTLQLPAGLYSIVPQVLEAPKGLGFYVRAFAAPTVQINLWRFDNKEGTLVSTASVEDRKVVPDTLIPAGVGKGGSVMNKTLKGGAGDRGGPEHIYRDPVCRPSERVYAKACTTVMEPTRSACKSMVDKVGYATTVGEMFDYAAKTCRTRTEEIIAQCQKNGKKFFDQKFYFASRKVMYPDGSPDDCTVTEPIDTARLCDLYPGVALMTEGATSNDITQGAIGDCFFIGAVSALASCTAKHINPLQRLFACFSAEFGIYGILFFKNGGWEWVIVDDVIAVNPDKTPMYANASQSELWPMLIEKAYAKMHYYWDSIDGGWGREALADMTGGFEYTIDLKEKVSRAEFQTLVDNPLTILGCAVGQHVEESGGVGHAGESGAVFGLFKGHAYSVIRFAVTSDGKAFVRVRNPWGNDAEWKGPYSDNGPEWKKNPVAMKELAPEFKADGAFWMIWEDFQKYFTDIDVCHFFESNWVTACQFGQSKGESYLSADNTFILEVIGAADKKYSIVLTLGQDDPKAQSDHAKQKQGSYAALRMSVYRLKSLPESYKGFRDELDLKVETKRLTNRQVHDNLELAPGLYSVVPQVLNVPKGRGFYVRAFAPSNVGLKLWRYDDKTATLVETTTRQAAGSEVVAVVAAPLPPAVVKPVVSQTVVAFQTPALAPTPPAGAPLTFEEAMLQAFDQGGNTISREVFQRISFRYGPLAAGRPPIPTPARRGESARRTPECRLGQVDRGGAASVDLAALRDLFDGYDTDGSGKVSIQEFQVAFRKFEQYGVPTNDKDIERLFTSFGLSDANKDGFLSFDEFSVLMLSRMKM